MEQIFFWGCWFAGLATTALLLFWSLPLSPFAYPGITANEAVIIFLFAMVIRWLSLATTLILIVTAWGRRLNLATSWIFGLSLIALILHLIFGLVNLGVMNAWLSIDQTRTRATSAVYAGIYFGLPILLLLFTGLLMVIVSRVRH